MNDYSIDDDSLSVGTKTWRRLMDRVNKVGYRHGVEEGSRAVLQADFDKGYIDGYKVAFIIGQYKAFTAFDLKDIEHPTEINDILEKYKKGICHICELESSNEEINSDPEIIINNHREHVSRTLHTLYSYFHPLLKDRGIDMSDLKYE